MDGCYVESRAWVLEDQPRLQALYAARFAELFRGIPGHPFEQGFDARLVPEKLAEPLKWSEPRMIFVNSMSDPFHDEVPDSLIGMVASTMEVARWHTYQVLTKRSGRLRKLLSGPLAGVAAEKHIWWGVSVENRKHGFPRIADLQASPAAVRFLSVEPLLEDLGTVPLDAISWVIVGGESGPRARSMKEDWVLSIREQCKRAHVPFFFKQWGGVTKKETGRILLRRTFDEFPRRVKNRTLPPEVRERHVSAIQSANLVHIA